MKITLHLCSVALSGVLLPALAHAASPDPAHCPVPESPEGGERVRTTPLPVPAELATNVKSDLYHYAAATLGGGAVCVDTSWMDSAEWLPLPPAGRFFAFEWLGYESYGHKLIDRGGKGAVYEIVGKPVFSRSGRLFAEVDQYESENIMRGGLAVWRVDAATITRVARIENLPQMIGLQIDSWAGERCLNLSGQPITATGEGPRTRYAARLTARGWRVARANAGCPRR